MSSEARGDLMAKMGGRGRPQWVSLLRDAPVVFGPDRQRTVAAEQLRKLAVQLEQKIAASGEPGYVLAVTSAEPNAGKTLTSLNLALMLARGGEKSVLLIECDLRAPSLRSYLRVDRSIPGLFHVLGGGTEIGKAALSVWAAGFDVVTAGQSGVADNLMTDAKMSQVLLRARSRYDLVILDSPPFLLASGRAVAELAHGVLVVARVGKTKKQALEEILSSLGPTKVLGITLNDLPEHRLALETYGAYGYYGLKDGKRGRRGAAGRASSPGSSDGEQTTEEPRRRRPVAAAVRRAPAAALRLLRQPLLLAGLLTGVVLLALLFLPRSSREEIPPPTLRVPAEAESEAAVETNLPNGAGSEVVGQESLSVDQVEPLPASGGGRTGLAVDRMPPATGRTAPVVEERGANHIDRAIAESELVGERLAAGRKWLAQADPEHYTVQLMLVVGDRAAEVDKFLGQSDVRPLLDEIYLYRRPRLGREMLGMVYGDYPELAQALEALQGLPPSLEDLDAYIRRVGAITSQISPPGE